MKKIVIVLSAAFCIFALSSCTAAQNSETSSVSNNTTKREADLKKPEKYEDVRGQLKDGVYSNESFGFTMSVNQKDFTAEVSDQEGFKYNFEHPTAAADDDVFNVYSADLCEYRLQFSQSSQQGHAEKTASDILARELSQYNISVTDKLLGDKQTAYTQVDRDGIKTDYYAMFVNGYYIKWEITFGTGNKDCANQLEQIVDSIQFDWISE